MLSRPNTALSQIHMQIMWSRLIAVVEEQAQTLMRTAFSTPVREAGDLSAGVFDRDGSMLAQAVTGTPGHVNSMAAAVKHFLAAFPLDTMKAGDHYITNDPWLTCGHLHDLTVVSPTAAADSSSVRPGPPDTVLRTQASWLPARTASDTGSSELPGRSMSTRWPQEVS